VKKKIKKINNFRKRGGKKENGGNGPGSKVKPLKGTTWQWDSNKQSTPSSGNLNKWGLEGEALNPGLYSGLETSED